MTPLTHQTRKNKTYMKQKTSHPLTIHPKKEPSPTNHPKPRVTPIFDPNRRGEEIPRSLLHQAKLREKVLVHRLGTEAAQRLADHFALAVGIGGALLKQVDLGLLK